MLNDTALKLDVFEALDQAVENGYWAEARLDEEIAEDLISAASVFYDYRPMLWPGFYVMVAADLIRYSQDFENYAEDDLTPHVADWKRFHGPR